MKHPRAFPFIKVQPQIEQLFLAHIADLVKKEHLWGPGKGSECKHSLFTKLYKINEK